jgi:hypothetical protein
VGVEVAEDLAGATPVTRDSVSKKCERSVGRIVAVPVASVPLIERPVTSAWPISRSAAVSIDAVNSNDWVPCRST